ncbi:MAG TPA: hypothetical protein PK598_02960, partial [Thermoanaerobaculia bacterium]|nr:hypothetical protein [Thermoanaerobaculia bacterium]
MLSTLRKVASVVAGFVAASVVMMIFESINGRFLYPGLAKAAEGMNDRQAIRALPAAAPAGAFVAVIAGWGVAGG